MTRTYKASLRQQFDEVKEEMERLKSSGKLSAEALALMKTMIMLFEIIIAAFLEKKTKKTSRNSSIPSSQMGNETTSPKAGSKGKGREGYGQASNFREVKTKDVKSVDFCPECSTDLGNVKPTTTETRTKIDIIFEKHVHEVTSETKSCPVCQTTTKAPFPKDMPGPLQYGAGLKSFIVNLIVAQMIPLKRCQQMIKAMIGQVLSESTIVSYVAKLGKHLAQWEVDAIEQLLKSPVVHVDETSMRVNRKKYWVHVHTAGNITVKMLHPKRGKAAINDNDIIPKYGGIIVHDCWASYLSYDHCGHGLCGAHLLRELAFIEESNGYRWAKNMKKLLLDTCRLVSSLENKKLGDGEYASLQRRYRSALTRGSKEMPAPIECEEGQKGRVAKSEAHNLLARLQKYEAAVLLFAKETHVPFTNNQAERELRMGKVKQKVSGCFRSEELAKAYCRISSYLQTMSANGVNPLVAIHRAFTGQIYVEMGE